VRLVLFFRFARQKQALLLYAAVIFSLNTPYENLQVFREILPSWNILKPK